MKRTDQNRRTLTTAAIALTLAALASCSNPLVVDMQNRITDDVTTFLAGDAPVVTAASPSVSATDVPTSTTIEATFSIGIDPDTLTAQSIKLLLLPGLTAVAGSVSYDAALRTVRFVPDARLDLERTYRLVVDGSVESAQGASLGSTFTAQFTTRWFHDDEIGIDLTYSSTDLVLNAGAPIIIDLIRVPLPSPWEPSDLVRLSSTPITASGKVRIPQSAMPSGATSVAMMMFHDIAGVAGEPDDDDPERFVKLGAPGNMTADASDVLIRDGDGPVVVDGFFLVRDEYVLSVGKGYAVTFVDWSPVTADAFESLDTSGSYRVLTQGTFETARNLHSLDDVDYLRFTAPTDDHYAIEVDATPFDLRVELYATDSAMLTRSGALASSTATSARTINTAHYQLTGGHTYYLRVDSPASYLGWYEIGFRLRDVPDDANEPNNTPNEATPLAFGRQNAITATLSDRPGQADADVYAISVTAGHRYAIEVTETDNYFGSHLDGRNAQFGITMYTSWDGSNGAGIWQTDLEGFYEVANGRVMFDATRVNVSSGTETRWLVVSNLTPTQGTSGERPSVRYTVAYTWGPDAWDREYVESMGAPIGPRTDDVIDGVLARGLEIYQPGEQAYLRTIYSGTDSANPGVDVDWFAVYARSATVELMVHASPADGPDGIEVAVQLFRNQLDGANNVPNHGLGAVGTAGEWASDSRTVGLVFQPWAVLGYGSGVWTPMENRVFWLRVTRRSVDGNPPTGRYALTVNAGADDEDAYYNPITFESDATVDVGGGEMVGIDETPWMGSSFGADFSNRNELGWYGSYGSRRTRSTLGYGLGLDEHYWTIYRRDYNGLGERDGVNDPDSDYDFFWTEVPAGGLNMNDFAVRVASESNPALPLKVSYWKVSSTAWTSYKSDGIVRESELGAPTGVQTTVLDGGAHQTYWTVSGVAAGEIFVFRVERNNAGALPDDARAGQYRFELTE